jgi:Na+/melibiose symporter-like transporter
VVVFGFVLVLCWAGFVVVVLWGVGVLFVVCVCFFDMRDRPAEVQTRKNMVQRHLDENIFFDSRYLPNHAYRTPVFRFQ